MWAFEAAAPICFAFQVEVGTRVMVVRGRRALGATGVVFWVGANKYGPGMRLGIHADHGKTLWIDLDHVEALGDDDVDHAAEERARTTLDQHQIAEEMEREAAHPVRLVPWQGPDPESAHHRAQHEERRAAALQELAARFGPADNVLDVVRLGAGRRAVLTVERLLLVDEEWQVLDSASVRRDELEPVFDGRALVVYGDYGEPMLYGVSHDRLKRLGSTRARVDNARVLGEHLLFESHGRFYEMLGAFAAVCAFEDDVPKKRRTRDKPPPLVTEATFTEAPPEVWSPWRVNDEMAKFPGQPRLARSASGRFLVAWDPREDLGGDLPRRTRLGYRDESLTDVSESFSPYMDRSIVELDIDASGRWAFLSGHRTLSRMDLETGAVETVHPKVPSFQIHDADCVVLFFETSLVWLERRGKRWVEAVRIKTPKAHTAAHCPSLDCTFLFGEGGSKAQAFVRVGDHALRIWTSKTPYIRAAFHEREVYLFRHAFSGARLDGFADLVEHARRKKRR